MIRLDDLGQYPDRGHGSPPGLTLHELGELLRRLGLEAGFEVRSEYKCFDGSKRAIDWVWLDKGKVVVAFELEGRDTDSKTFRRDVEKLTSPRLRRHGCLSRLVVFFQVNHDLYPKSEVADPKARVANWSRELRSGVDVLLDVELLSEAGRKRVLAATRRLK